MRKRNVPVLRARSVVAGFLTLLYSFIEHSENPLHFCGRMSTSTGTYDAFYKDVSESAALGTGVMDIKYPGDSVVVNGVHGVLGKHCQLLTPTSNGDPHFTTWVRKFYF